MANKLKNMRLTSVDLVRNGANQEADICLYKSADPAEAPEQPTEAEIGIFKRLLNFLRENPTEGDVEPTDPVEKDYSTFGQINSNRENSDKLWRYTDALTCSIRSIQEDHDLDKDQKLEMMKQSLSEFSAAMEDLLEALCNATKEAPALIKSDKGEEDDEVDELEDEDDDIDEIEVVEKFNPYHDSRGRFASSGSAASFTYSPGKSKAHDMAIAREKERQAAAGGSSDGGAKRMNIDEETDLILETERDLASGKNKPETKPTKQQMEAQIKSLKPPKYNEPVRVESETLVGTVARVRPGYKRADHANDYMYAVNISNKITGENVFRTNRYGSTASSGFKGAREDLLGYFA